MTRWVPIVLLALCACGQPTRLVIDDDPELVHAVMVGLTELEQEVGCKLFKSVEVGGSKRDWRGGLPPNGTVTVKAKPGLSRPGWAHYGPTKSRYRVTYVDSRPGRTLVAHELTHALGIGHVGEDGLMGWRAMSWDLSPDLLEQLRTKCVDGPAGPALR